MPATVFTCALRESIARLHFIRFICGKYFVKRIKHFTIAGAFILVIILQVQIRCAKNKINAAKKKQPA